MTSGEPSGPSAARMGGYALIGVGAVAAAIGAATAFAGEPGDEQPVASAPVQPAPLPAQQPAAGPAPQPVAPARPPAQPAEPPAANRPPAQQPAGPPPVQLAPGTGSDQQPGDPGQSAKISVRIYNNSTVKGLAHRAADDFRAAGYDVPEAGNYPWGKIATTTVYYRPGTPEQTDAEQVAAQFGARAEPRFPGLQDATPGIIGIITDDYKGPQQQGK